MLPGKTGVIFTIFTEEFLMCDKKNIAKFIKW